MRLLAPACVFLLASLVHAGTVDPPQRIKTNKLDKTEINGLVTSYTEEGIEVMDNKKQMSKVAWEEFPPDAVINLYTQLAGKGTAEEFMNLGKKLLTMPGGRGPAVRAFQRALKLDPTLKDQIATIQKEAALKPAAAASRPYTAQAPELREDPTRPATGPSHYEPKDPMKPIVGPKQVGAADPSAWGKQTPEEATAAVAKLKQFADEAQKKLNLKLTPFETQFFLFYTDLPQADAMKWAGLLDKMYARMSELFAVPKGENLWRGKALVFVFSKDDDYLKFEMKCHATMAAGTDGMCHAYGTGDVHIAFYRQPNDLDFAHVLVHETTHGFLHRYRSPVPIPSWANEGLAEVIASEMIKRPGLTQSATAEAKNDLMNRKNLGKFFEADHIVAWQYPVSRTLTEFMIVRSKQGYVEFINGIKDGLSWDEAMKQKYGVTVEQLVNAYGMSMGVAGLKAE